MWLEEGWGHKSLEGTMLHFGRSLLDTKPSCSHKPEFFITFLPNNKSACTWILQLGKRSVCPKGVSLSLYCPNCENVLYFETKICSAVNRGEEVPIDCPDYSTFGLPWWLTWQSNAGDLGSIPWLGRFPGEGHGNPLQYSCLENPMDRGDWWATVPEVSRSWTQLSN